MPSLQLHKRLNHFLDEIEKREVASYKKFLKGAKKLDPIEKKQIKYPEILYPGKEIPVEWWYFTGHLSSGNLSYGFEFCIFKMNPQALRIGPLPMSLFRKSPYLIMHSAITDKTKKTFKTYQETGFVRHEKISYNSLDFSLDDSHLRLKKGAFNVRTKQLSLSFKPIKKLIKHFDEGYNIMFTKPQYRTYYVSFTRMKVKGKLNQGSISRKVSGLAWFDHQKSNKPTRTPILGWDWFSIMFNDKTELMFFALHDKRGLNHCHMGGSYIDENSKVTKLSPKEVKITRTGTWKSKKTGITYPSGWLMNVPKIKLTAKITPCIPEQEVDSLYTSAVSYWEGACDVSGKKAGTPIKGQSYVELVGYDNRLIAKLIRKSAD